LFPRDKLRNEAKEQLNSFLREIQPLAPRCVILFGSYARGNFTESSDVDVCVIAENLPKEELARRCLTGLYSTSRVKAIGFYPDEFIRYLENLRFLAYDIIAYGMPVLDDGFYARMKRVFEACVEKYGVMKEAKGWRVLKALAKR